MGVGLCSNCGAACGGEGGGCGVSQTSPEFVRVVEWARQERAYQGEKWDYAAEDEARIKEGLGEEAWFWRHGIENYAGRVRVFGIEHPLGRQAYLKLITTLMGGAEALLRLGLEFPKPGLSSGNTE